MGLSSRASLFFLAFLFASPLCSTDDSGPPSWLEEQAEDLTHGFNLNPPGTQNGDPSSTGDRSFDAQKLPKRRWDLPCNASEASVENLARHAGYYYLPNTHASRMFYYFFDSRANRADPLVLWLTGGPGCSSSVALFYENGPFSITNNLSLKWNEFGWDKVSNILYVDQPIGTGFSYSTNSEDFRHNEEEISDDLYYFLQAFLKQHHQYSENDFFITGESYAGKYIPALATRIQKGNSVKQGRHINLKGVAIGNGLTSPLTQYLSIADFALENGLTTKFYHDAYINNFTRCGNLTIACNESQDHGLCSNAYKICEKLKAVLNIQAMHPEKNFYDIRMKCAGKQCYDFSNMEKLYNQSSVKAALGVGNLNFVSCNKKQIFPAFEADHMLDASFPISQLLEANIKVLLYVGIYDFVCNWIGNARWAVALKWSDQKKFQSAPFVPYLIDNNEAGMLKTYGPFSFLKVYNAGHMVPMDQPRAALEMLKRWMEGNLA